MTQVEHRDNDRRIVQEPESASPDAPSTTDGRRRTAIALAVLVLLLLLPLRGLLRSQGPPMEEGFMLVFPEMVLEGLLPNRDFLHLYGPGSLWILAGAFDVFGTSLVTERLVGLLQQAGIIFAIFAIARAWGRTTALLCAAISLVIIVPPIGLTALAWVGAVALGLWAMYAGLVARHAVDERRTRRWALGAGLLAGAALLYRPDLVLALSLGGGAVLWGVPRTLRNRVLTGLAIGVSPYLVHLATAGVEPAFRGMILDPVFYLRGGRRLPLPPSPDRLDGFLQRAGDLYPLSWPFPTLTTAAQLTAWFLFLLFAVAVLVVAGVRAVRRDPSSRMARTLFVLAMFTLGILPQAIQRSDSTHLAWVACVPVALLPIALSELLAGPIRRLPALARRVAPAVAVLVAVTALAPDFTTRAYADYTAQTFGEHRLSFRISHDGRTYYYGRRDVADALHDLLDDVDRITEPGDRLFVGTRDLRKTPYNDSFIYYLLPDLEVATYYVEMDPGVANREGSGLDDDVASADVLVLTSVWDPWDEPNDSRKVGSDAPNEVIRDQFCSVRSYDGLYELFERC